MLTQEQVQQFRQDGFLIGPQVVDEGDADALRERMHEVLEERSAGRAESNRNLSGDESGRVVRQIVNIWEAEPLFRDHIHNEKICKMVAQLIGCEVLRVWHDQIQYKPPRVGGPTNWHQDHGYWPIVEPADLVSAWMALDDATVENGCMSMVPRSHTWGRCGDGTIGTDPETFEPTPQPEWVPEGETVEVVPCEVKKGQVMFHHCLTWHGSPNNTSERGRPAIAVHYMPGYTRYEPKGSHLMSHRVEVEPGEILEGGYFPKVWDNGPVAVSA